MEEWDTNSLQIVEKEDVTPARTLPSMLPLLQASEDEDEDEANEDEADKDSSEMTRSWIPRDAEDSTGNLPDIAAETFSHIQRTDVQSSPFAFSSGYTTMELFQQGMPPAGTANTSVTHAVESEPEDADTTVLKSGLDYIRQLSTSPVLDNEEMCISLDYRA